jgi:hypothetical protein
MISVAVLLVVGLTAWFYFNKFTQSEKAYRLLHKKYTDLKTETCRLRERVQDLDAYKTDVSKTFKILDNELISINNEIQRTKPDHPLQAVTTGNVSILSPEFLNSLFNNINQEQPTALPQTPEDPVAENQTPEKPEGASLPPNLPSTYDEFLLDNNI